MTIEDIRWEEIRYDLVETGYFDFESRPKTLRAVQQVVKRMTDDERQVLLETVSIVFAPAPGKHGEVFPYHGSPPVSASGRKVMVYLSPEIECRSQTYVNSVVAHEFAHVLLHSNWDEPAPATIEQGADEKVQEWGFKPAYHEYPE